MKKEKNKKKRSEIKLDITWGELDYQFKKAKEAKEHKNKRLYE